MSVPYTHFLKVYPEKNPVYSSQNDQFGNMQCQGLRVSTQEKEVPDGFWASSTMHTSLWPPPACLFQSSTATHTVTVRGMTVAGTTEALSLNSQHNDHKNMGEEVKHRIREEACRLGSSGVFTARNKEVMSPHTHYFYLPGSCNCPRRLAVRG